MPLLLMKKIAAIVYFFFAAVTYGQSPSDTSLDARINQYLARVSDTSFSDLDRHELIMLTFQVQNKGFMLEEQQGDFAAALPYIDRALAIFTVLDDTTNMANLLKYRGYLYGSLGRFSEGRRDAFRSVALYRALRWGFGVAVARFDLAKIYEAEHKTDSAFLLLEESLHYWKTVKDTFRLVTTNTFLMHLYLKERDYVRAGQIYQTNLCMIDQAKLHWRPLIDFYYVSYQYFTALPEKKEANRYLTKYTRKVEELRIEGITARSGYERE